VHQNIDLIELLLGLLDGGGDGLVAGDITLLMKSAPICSPSGTTRFFSASTA